jgi:PleD family two-component response regulator
MRLRAHGIWSCASVTALGAVASSAGKELVLVLPETDTASACVVAKRCRKVVLGEQIAHVRCVIGPYLTVEHDHSGRERLAHELLEAVDKLLYRAKQVGRTTCSRPLSHARGPTDHRR